MRPESGHSAVDDTPPGDDAGRPPRVRRAWPDVEASPTAAGRALRLMRNAAVAVLPALIAFAANELVFARIGGSWILMIVAVIVSASNGTMATGLVSTILSACLFWWFFVPPVRTFTAIDPAHYLLLAVFVAVGFAVSLLFDRLRITTDRLGRVARQNGLFAALIQNSPDFIGFADRDGNPLFINEGGRRMVELPEDVQIERTTVTDFYAPRVRPYVRDQFLAPLRAQGRWVGETELRNWRTEASIPVLVTRFIIRDPASRSIIGLGSIIRDISAEKAQRDDLQEANRRLTATASDLRESQRFLQGILDYSPNAIVIKNLDGRYLIANEEFAAICNRPPDQAKGKVDAELFPVNLAQRLHANDRRTLETGKPVVTEEVVERDGHKRVFVVTKFPLLDDADKIYAICAIWTDISSRKQNEEELARVASDLRRAQTVAHVGSWRWNVKTGESEWSDELYRIFGLEPVHGTRTAPLILRPEKELLTPESLMRLRAAVDKTLVDGFPYEMDLEFIRPDRTTGWVTARGEAIHNEAGEIIGLVGTAADITKLKELQRHRDEWTSIIAHDLRQPIGTILMASSLLTEVIGTGAAKNEKELAERIHTAGAALKRLVEDLLDMSLLEANRLKLERKNADPGGIARKTVEHLSHLPGIERVRLSVDAKLTPICVDPLRIEQVVANLISNAIKYGDPRTEVIVRVTQQRNTSEIAVTNTGRGITREEMPTLFERFTRSRSTRGSGVRGLGLGLYISRGVVQAHGGRISAESTPGKTTTFRIILPLSTEVREAA